MTRALNLVAVSALIFAASNARALDATIRKPAIIRTHAISRTPSLKQQAAVQMSTCMTRRMAADRVITYYDAVKFCQDRLNHQAADAASRTLLASVTPATP